MGKEIIRREYIIIANLTKRIIRKEVCTRNREVYGRLLATQLMREYGEPGADRGEAGNAVVLVPGFFTGNPAPSAGRMFIATSRRGADGLQICNITGNMPEALAANGIAAVVILGSYSRGNGILRIHRSSGENRTADQGMISVESCETGTEEIGGDEPAFTVTIENLPGATGKETGRIVRALRAMYGKDCAAIGIGPAGERKLAISAVFSTYAAGYPEYYVPRNSFGDVFGSKGLRAVVVETDSTAGQRFRGMADPETFERWSTELANGICQNEICGKALPSYGAMVLQSGLRDAKAFERYQEAPEKRIDCLTDVDNVHRACTPYCVIGCLNRHVSRKKKSVYRDPLHIEAEAKLKDLFDIDDVALTEQIVERTNALGISSTEYIETASVYAACTGSKGTPARLRKWLEELEQDTAVGRVIGGGADALNLLYPGVSSPRKAQERSWENRIDTGLREEIIALDNLGFCIFAAFAIVGNEEAWKQILSMMEAQTGEKWTKEEILCQSRKTMTAEADYIEARAMKTAISNLPKFAGILQEYVEIK